MERKQDIDQSRDVKSTNMILLVLVVFGVGVLTFGSF